ncbi:MAG: tRNA (guanosine(37)-N1)-methyltransferase TrmD [Cytophagales bacterium]|nr:tRNA (guanosine(37)-N1)-methyltransferase TrmD [Cytophagales bacterium]
MLRIDIISCLPDLLSSPLEGSIVKRAQQRAKVQIAVHSLRDYTTDSHRTVDDEPYGGGGGMVLKVEPVDRCIQTLFAERDYDEVIFLSPDGTPWTQTLANRYSLYQNLILLCGHYKGVDERVREHLVTQEISVGDYVLTGGELPALILVDSVVRLLPGVLNNESSALSDSFQDGLLGAPVYTRPAEYKGWKVPEILRSGHEAKIEAWRYKESLKRTKSRRPDSLSSS